MLCNPGSCCQWELPYGSIVSHTVIPWTRKENQGHSSAWPHVFNNAQGSYLQKCDWLRSFLFSLRQAPTAHLQVPFLLLLPLTVSLCFVLIYFHFFPGIEVKECCNCVLWEKLAKISQPLKMLYLTLIVKSKMVKDPIAALEGQQVQVAFLSKCGL